MTTENTIALVSLGLFLIIQTGGICYYLGRVESASKGKHEGLLNDILYLKGDVTGIGLKVEKNRETSYEDFVSKVECSGIQDTWESRLDAVLSHRNLWNDQNAKEHGDLKTMAVATHKRLEEIIECIHKLDKRIPKDV